MTATDIFETNFILIVHPFYYIDTTKFFEKVANNKINS